MPTVSVHTSSPYEVFIDDRTIDDVGAVAQATAGGTRALVISDSHVAPHYLARVRTSLADAGYHQVASHVFPAGEESKTLATYGACLEAAARAQLGRGDVMVALGGGVVGDVAGFAAATYMRGCHCVQVPTSLLAMVDSSVGGKTAVDLPQGKNLAGAFFQPSAVVADTRTLDTLSAAFFKDGAGEIAKYGAIADEALFTRLERGLARDDTDLPAVIARCVEIKRDLVEADEREAGVRRYLNFGHTLGHAIERLSGFTESHGCAVVTGMCLISRAAATMGCCDASVPRRINAFARTHGYATTTRYSADELFSAALSDKKRQGDTMPVVVVPAIGRCEVVPLSLADFRTWIEAAR